MNFLGKVVAFFALVAFFAACSASAQGIVGSTLVGSLHPVTNAPYSAVQETEHTQTLANGVHVVTKNHVRIYRDSAGRTRREIFFPEGEGVPLHDGPLSIMIEDSVAGVIYNLQTQNHTAHAMNIPHLPQVLPPTGSPSPAGTPVVRPPLNRTPPTVTSEDLGTQIIDGVEAQGRRTTRTIPTGAQGNDGPIVMTTETWESPELHLTILTKVSDPRSGENVMRITNLDRSEPDPALFQVPPDYTIVDADRN